jgi:hypothetical protein
VHLLNRRHNCQPKQNVLMLYGSTLCRKSRHRHLVNLYSTNTATSCFTFHEECILLFYSTRRLHRVTLYSTKAPCYFTLHQDWAMLLYIPLRYLVTSHSTKTAFCYFTFHQIEHFLKLCYESALHITKVCGARIGLPNRARPPYCHD